VFENLAPCFGARLELLLYCCFIDDRSNANDLVIQKLIKCVLVKEDALAVDRKVEEFSLWSTLEAQAAHDVIPSVQISSGLK
jgi:hypothetical protein